MGKVLEDIEGALLTEAEIYTPEGSEPKAVVHQWVHAIAHDLPLFGEVNGAKKEVIIKILKGKALFKNKKSFHHELTAKLPILTFLLDGLVDSFNYPKLLGLKTCVEDILETNPDPKYTISALYSKAV